MPPPALFSQRERDYRQRSIHRPVGLEVALHQVDVVHSHPAQRPYAGAVDQCAQRGQVARAGIASGAADGQVRGKPSLLRRKAQRGQRLDDALLQGTQGSARLDDAYPHDARPVEIGKNAGASQLKSKRGPTGASGAQRASVELSGTADAISLRIVDDGTGFDPRLIQGKGGLGLVSMRERVLHLGGEIAIDSQPSGGTRLHVRVPLQDTEHTSGDGTLTSP